MFTLCPECNQHYDDSFESKQCAGPDDPYREPHRKIATSPLEDHKASTSGANVRKPTKGRPLPVT